MKTVNELRRYIPLLKELIQRDLKVRYRHSFLGMLWTVLNPLLMMIVLTVVFSNMFKTNIDNFPVYVLIGQIVFGCISEGTTQGMNSIVWNAHLINKVYIPKYLFPLSSIVSSLVNFGFSFVAMLIVMLFTRSTFYITIFTVWIPVLYMLIFEFGLSLLLCTANVFFRDMQHLYSVFTTAWMYLSVIFYSIDILPEWLQTVVALNPAYKYISFIREIVMFGTFPSLATNISCALAAIVSLVIGIAVFRKYQGRFILYI